MESVIHSVAEVSNVAQQLHIQFAHYAERWEDMEKEHKRPYIRAASLLVAARLDSDKRNR